MRKAKQMAEILAPEPVEEGTEEVNVHEKNGFFACYLLCSLCPRYKGHTYIGFTINPRRRIRQHNGEIRCGAWRTKCKRPWEMILCIHGFPSKVSALQFEWAWQHPKESLAVRKAAASFKSLSGIENKIKLAYTMLTLPEWDGLYLKINFFSTKYMSHSAHCPRLPKQMRVTVHAMDELPCYMGNNILDVEHDENSDKDEDVGDLDTDISASMGTSMNYPFENSCQRDHEYDSPYEERELYDSLCGEREYDDLKLQRKRRMTSHGFTKPSKSKEEKNRTPLSRKRRSAGMAYGGDLCRQKEDDDAKQLLQPVEYSCLILSPVQSNKEKLTTSDKRTTWSRTRNAGMACGGEPCRLQEDDAMQLAQPMEASCFTLSPVHSNKEKLPSSDNIIFPSNKEPFDSVNSSNLALLKQLSTPRTVKCGISFDGAPLSPECSIIDLSTPSSCIPVSDMCKPSICVEIIDLIDSPI